MLAGALFGRVYSWADYGVTLLLCLGVICFTQADATTSPAFELGGVLMLALSTSSDALRLNLSESLMSATGAAAVSRRHVGPRSVFELLFYSESIGLLLVLPIVLLSGELRSAAAYFSEQPQVLGLLALMGGLAFLGGLAMMQFVQQTSAYALSLVGIARMLFSISLSIVLYRKTIVYLHVLGTLLCALGLYGRTLIKKQATGSKGAKARRV